MKTALAVKPVFLYNHRTAVQGRTAVITNGVVMFRVAALFFVLVFFCISSSEAALMPEQQELFLSSSVKLRVDADNVHSWGTGTIIDTRNGEALILTCGHIFRERIQQNNNQSNNTVGNAPVEVHLYGGKTSAKVDGHCLFCDLETDIALIAVKPPFPIQAVAVAPPDYIFQSGQTVWSSGCGGGANPSLEQHQIMSLDRISPVPVGKDNQQVPFHYIQVSGAPVSGRSGGGLFTADNYLIGVCNTGDPQNNDGQFVPPEVIRQILQSMKLETVYERPSLNDNGIAKIEMVPNNAASFPPISMPTAAIPNGKIASNAAVDFSTPQTVTLLPLRPVDNTDIVIPQDTNTAGIGAGISNVEQATLEEIKRRTQDGDEVILIIRSRRNPEIPSDVIVLNGTSDQFLNQLAQGAAKDPQGTANYAEKNYTEKYEPAILTSPLTMPLPLAKTPQAAQTGSQAVSFPVFHK